MTNDNTVTRHPSFTGPLAGLDMCECDHPADQHNDEQPHECLALTLKGRARCSCPTFKKARD